MRNEERITGGTFGISDIPRPTLFGFSLDGNLPFFYFMLGITLLLAALLWGLLRSPWGKAFAALRDNPIRAESLGVNITGLHAARVRDRRGVRRHRRALFASLVEFIEPAPFTWVLAHDVLMVVVGGPGYFFGPVLGTAVVVLLPEWLRFVQAWYLFVFGVAVVVLMIWLPGGLLSIPDRFRSKARRRVKRRRPAQLRPAGSERHHEPVPWGCSHERAVAESDGPGKKAYGAIKAVDGVQLRGEPGEIFGVIGPNGSGKTTMFNSVLGQIKPNAGRIEFCGEDITGMSPLELPGAASAARSRRCRCSARCRCATT